MPQTPTTKILAVGTFAPGTDMSQVQRILPTEVRETGQLYLAGKIDQWYSLEDRPGVVFILNMTDTQAAHAVLERPARRCRTGSRMNSFSRTQRNYRSANETAMTSTGRRSSF